MRKALISALAVMYMTITSGVMVNVHYCMGEFAALSFGNEADSHCGKCGMEDQAGCCHTDHQLVKTDDNHLLVQNLFEGFGLAEALVPAASAEPQLSLVSHSSSSYYHHPPDQRLNKLRLYNGVFRI